MSPRPHVLLTGSTRGIGAAISSMLTERGARVVGHGRREAEGVVGADLGDPAAADRLWDAALDRLDGRIDVLINNAGIADELSVDAPLSEWQAAWVRVLQINLQAAADLCRRAVQHFQQSPGGGRIVNVASRASYRGDSPTMWHYAASKAGMVGMTKSIARGYASQGILAFSLCPGWVTTDMGEDVLGGPRGAEQIAEIPLGRAADAAEIASVATFLALDAPPSMTGASVDVNGGSFVR
jgi:NAD(P)-dependent dehydrogenase (short-subunit alcohol dehydrogenase family)